MKDIFVKIVSFCVESIRRHDARYTFDRRALNSYSFYTRVRAYHPACTRDIHYNARQFVDDSVKFIVVLQFCHMAKHNHRETSPDGGKSTARRGNFNALLRKSFHWTTTRRVITLLHRNERYCVRSRCRAMK